MNDIMSLIRAAGRRIAVTLYLRRLHVTAVVVAAIAVGLVVLGKAHPSLREAIDWRWWGGGLFAATLLAAAAWWAGRRPTPTRVAMRIDERLGLRERFSTALLCRDRDDPFARAAVDDAIEAARDPRIRKRLASAFRVEVPSRWWTAPVLVALAMVIYLVVPDGQLWGSPSDARAALTPEEEAEVEQIEATVETLEQQTAETLGITEEELEEMLAEVGDPSQRDEADKPLGSEEARRQAFKRLTGMQEELRAVTEGEKAKALEAMLDKFAQLEAAPGDGPASDLERALAQGDFSAAKEALEELADAMNDGNVSEGEKQAMAEQMENLAEQLDRLAANNRALADSLRKAGLDPELANNPQDLAQALENASNLTDQQRQQLEQMAQAAEQANSAMQGMGAAAQQMAAQMGGSGQPGQSGQQGQSGMQAMAGQLSAMEMVAAEMQSANATMASVAGQCQAMGEGLGSASAGGSGGGNSGQGMGQGQGQGMASSTSLTMAGLSNGNGRGAGMGGRGQGQGGRANRFAAPFTLTPDKANVHTRAGHSIGTRFVDSEHVIKGESTAGYKAEIEAVASRAVDEQNDNRIPPRYRGVMKRFFGDVDALVEIAEDQDAGADAAGGN